VLERTDLIFREAGVLKTNSPLPKVDNSEHFRVITPTTLGYISVEGSRAGISRLEFVKVDEHSVSDAVLSVELQTHVSAAVAAINEPHTAANVPLQPQGSPFQRSVWCYLQTVPVGETRTYAEIARALGVPKSYRAVANACGANSIAILIPCHRAIRSDGSYGGYRWGTERKIEILNRERRCRVMTETLHKACVSYNCDK